jgi:lysophospholipase L1-like esterase
MNKKTSRIGSSPNGEPSPEQLSGCGCLIVAKDNASHCDQVVETEMSMAKLTIKWIAISTITAALCGGVNTLFAETDEQATGAGAVTIGLIGLIGDSTVAEESGWGPAFASRFNRKAKILNYAKNGATLQSLSGRLDELLKEHPDYVMVQFGHNDQKRYGTEEYSERLTSYIQRIQAAGGTPIVLSSVVRRTFDGNGKIVSRIDRNERFEFKDSLSAYAEAARATAEKMNVAFIDLHGISKAHHEAIGPEASMAYDFKEGDRTHFNRVGGEAIAGLIIPALTRIVPRLGGCPIQAEPGASKTIGKSQEQMAFEKALAAQWKQVFADDCTGDWQDKWFLDGEVGTVNTGTQGMILAAGPEFKNDAHHTVLWTKQSFEGDLKIEYDYTRIDNENRCVNILYIQATGSGKNPWKTDIAEWSGLRKVPAMATYFNHMNTYHVSYAAFGNDGADETGYIRGRRYLPEGKGLRGTELIPEYRPEGLFEPGVTHCITVIKHDRDLFLRISNPQRTFHGHMRNSKLPSITEGRVGLRHMFTRSARYRNFRISVPDSAGGKVPSASD